MKSKVTNLITLVLIVSGLSFKSQAQNFAWANNIGGTGYEYEYDVSTDAGGNTLVIGNFDSPTLVIGSTTLTNAGGDDIFIAKYDASGNVLWAKSIGGAGYDNGRGITTDASGNILVTGFFDSPTLLIGTTTLTNAGSSDIFIAKFDISGNFLWANSIGGTDLDCGIALTTDTNGNVLVTGYFASPTIVVGTTTLTNAGSTGDRDIFVAQYNAAGNALWANSIGGTAYDFGFDVTTDVSGNVFVTGFFKSPTLVIGTTTLTSAGNYDCVIAKYDNSGNVLWAKNFGGANDDYGYSISTDANGNVFVAGYYDSPTLVIGTTTLTNAGSNDGFIAKYDASGNSLWANHIGGTGNDGGISISTDASGNLLISGFFSSSSLVIGTTTLTNAGSRDVFTAKYDASGNSLWANHIGGTGDDVGNCVATDANGNVFVAGYYDSPTLVIGTTTLTNAGGPDVFIAKINAGATGVIENTFSESIKVFPNPFSAQITLGSSNQLYSATLTVFNIYGQIVTQINNISGQKVTLERNGLVTGQYFIRLTEGNKEIITKKIIITD